MTRKLNDKPDGERAVRLTSITEDTTQPGDEWASHKIVGIAKEEVLVWRTQTQTNRRQTS
ncbi:hypothetical protein [Thalassobacillus sp. CUG 92003]|uniref:hypothetical protein n=1 Tax=Thalassobacillus sp. CUG 92003 TaxID=2736641 RepID=UPI0015E79F3A|nr:hypothetical protein [Thalassobacillus sp. CUG 92003]